MHYTGPSLLAVATGIVGSAWVSGGIISFSIASAPAAAAIPQSSTQIWAELYKRGAASMPKFAAAVALSYMFAAYDSYNRSGPWESFLGAAGCVLSIVPFTLVVMKDTNASLHKAAAKEGDVSATQVSSLLNKWIVLNLMRGLLPLAGTVLGCRAFLRSSL